MTLEVGQRVTYRHEGYEVRAIVLKIDEIGERILVESNDVREWIFANDVVFQRGEYVVDADGNVVGRITMVDSDGDLRVKNDEGSSFVYRTHVRKKVNA